MLWMLETLGGLAGCKDGGDSTADSAEYSACEAQIWGADADGDGYGSADFTLTACEEPQGYVNNTDDCDDTNADYYPGAPVHPGP